MAQTKPRRSCLTLVPRSGTFLLREQAPTHDALMALTPQTPQSRDVGRMLAEARKHILGIEITRIKTVVAEATVGDLVEHATSVFDGVAGRIINRKELPRAAEHSAFYDEFSTMMLQVAARDLVQIHSAGTASIMRELERSTYVEYQEPTLLDRLLGRE